MTKQWIVFGLTAVGAVIVILFLYRKVVSPALTTVASGAAGSQASIGGFRQSSPKSTIEISPATVKSKSTWDFEQYVNSLPRD